MFQFAFCCSDKHGDQIHLGEEVVYGSFEPTGYSPLSKKAKPGTQLRDLELKSWKKAAHLFTAQPFIHLRTTCSGIVLPTVGWDP